MHRSSFTLKRYKPKSIPVDNPVALFQPGFQKTVLIGLFEYRHFGAAHIVAAYPTTK